MKLSDTIRENIWNGLVLDERGRWVKLEEKCRKERDFLSHLMNGEIIFNNRWARISDITAYLKKQGFKKKSQGALKDLLKSQPNVHSKIDSLNPFTPAPVPDAPETEYFEISRDSSTTFPEKKTGQ